jgi:hypothetical protein
MMNMENHLLLKNIMLWINEGATLLGSPLQKDFPTSMDC